MKKYIAALMVAFLTAALAGCGQSTVTEDTEPDKSTYLGGYGRVDEVNVHLKDGRTITCLVASNGRDATGVSCDWNPEETP